MFDIGSLLVSLTVVTLILSVLLLLFQATGSEFSGVGEMACAMLAASLGSIAAYAASQSQNRFFLYGASLLFVTGFLLIARAICRLQEKPPQKWVEAVCVLTALVVDGWLILVEFDVGGMFIVNSILFAVIAARSAKDLLLEKRPELIRGCQVLGLLFAVFALFMGFRAVARPFMETGVGPLPNLTALDAIAALVSMASVIVWTVGVLWTVCNRSAYRLKIANAKLERFTGAVAHDLKAPLNSIIGFLGIIQRTMPADNSSKAGDYLVSASDAAWRMNEFIDDLLVQAITTNENQFFSPVDAGECSRDAAKNLHHQLAETRGEIDVSPLPVVLGSKTQITRLFQNLYDNALKYRAPGRIPVIKVTSEVLDGAVLFAVCDNGIGIPANAQAHVFNYMQRSDHTADVTGTGVGLSECKRIVENHGGSIWVESQPDQGSVFHFTIRHYAEKAVKMA